MSSFKLSTILCATAFTIVAFGAGCSKQSTSIAAPQPQLEQLRTPPPASIPTQEPTVPQEAAKIPRPY